MRVVQFALQVAVSLVSAMAAAGFCVPAAASETAHTFAPEALDSLWGRGGAAAVGIGEVEDKGLVAEEGNWQQRQVFAAGGVWRGCEVMEAVSDLLYSLVARRPQEVPSAIPALLQACILLLIWHACILLLM
jgi:hypothetical protein